MASVTSVCGSSPLTRGKQSEVHPHTYRGGLIPAHAGKTQIYDLGYYRERAHPRSRGENIRSAYLTAETAGSSPLTRGKPVQAAHDALCPRLIPAHAGKTGADTRLRRGPAAHPRSRGENPPAVAWKVWLDGSSPLTRGKRDLIRIVKAVSRLIPAHAGKTPFEAVHERPIWAHPRSRGENAIPQCSGGALCGSSPLTRGKQDSP